MYVSETNEVEWDSKASGLWTTETRVFLELSFSRRVLDRTWEMLPGYYINPASMKVVVLLSTTPLISDLQ
jgi:hypothetical protein